MILDGRSLLAVAAALCLLLGLVVLALERRLSQPVAGLRMWAISNVALAAGAGLHMLQGHAPSWVPVLAGNAFVVAGRACAVAALLQYGHRRVPLRALLGFSMVVLLGIWAMHDVWPSPQHRALVLLTGLAAFSGWAAAAVLAGGAPSVGRIVTFGGLAGMALAHLSRLAMHASEFGGERALDLDQPVIAVHIALLVTLDTLVNVGFVLLVTERMHDWVLQLARTDHLTGALARGAFHALARRDLQRARRQGTTTAAFVVDIDHFKNVNDQSGHAAGDAVLKHVSRHGQEVLRCTDLFCRHGGDEFVALLPDTDLLTAAAIAERLRLAVADPGPGLPPDLPPVTVSIGVASFTYGRGAGDGTPAGEGARQIHAASQAAPRATPVEQDIDTLIAHADAALYHAKRAGRNRTRVSEDEAPPEKTSLQLIQGHR